MRITLRTQGGIAHFPGLARGVTVDLDLLPAEAAAALADLVAKARLFDRDEPPAAPPAPDARTYELVVEDGERRRTLRVVEPLPPDLQDLVDRVGRLARSSRPVV
ncbi:MAG TPA: protealysin inhibitor emfourin [Myxococcales bacterium]|jgi:hypothetical protein|nr:protealysin inhibitor emfourin [Myxococcales bacterium]